MWEELVHLLDARDVSQAVRIEDFYSSARLLTKAEGLMILDEEDGFAWPTWVGPDSVAWAIMNGLLIFDFGSGRSAEQWLEFVRHGDGDHRDGDDEGSVDE